MRITIAPMPSPAIFGTLMLCAQSNANYSVLFTAGTSYAWSVTGGTINGSSTSNAINVTWGTSGSGICYPDRNQ
jgi:hypothetical protein